MRTEEQTSSPLSLGLWTDAVAARAISDELVPLESVARHVGMNDEVEDTSTLSMPWPYLHRRVVPADGSSGA